MDELLAHYDSESCSAADAPPPPAAEAPTAPPQPPREHVVPALLLCILLWLVARIWASLANRKKLATHPGKTMLTNEQHGGPAPAHTISVADAGKPRCAAGSVAWCCQAGMQTSMRGRSMPKKNQDRCLALHSFAGHRNLALFGVFDGHGEHGGAVADFAAEQIPQRLAQHADLMHNPRKALIEVFLEVNDMLLDETEIQAAFGGTTAVVALVKGDMLYVANLGDSRAVLGTLSEGSVRAVALSEDQTPELPEERARIVALGGFVSPPPHPGLSSRVWLDSEQTLVGLAMSRSIGDLAVKKIGVIAEPVVTGTQLARSADVFLLLASDGIWTFVSSDEAVDCLHEELLRLTRGGSGGGDGGAGGGTGANGAAAALGGACEELVSRASARWAERVAVYRDDISALLVALQPSGGEGRGGTGG